MRFLLTLIAGLLAPSLFAANLSFLAPTNDVLPTNLNKLYVTSAVARATAAIGTNTPRATLTTHGDFIVRSPMDGSQMYWSTSNARLDITIGALSGGAGVAVRSDGSVATAMTNFLTRNAVGIVHPGTNDFSLNNNGSQVLLTTNGNLLPNVGAPHNLGGPLNAWATIYMDTILAGDGSVGAPVYSFQNNPTSGLFNDAGSIAFTVGGSQRAAITSVGLGIATNAPASSLEIYSANASSAFKINSRHKSSIVNVQTNGNFGIGTNAPAVALHVVQGAAGAMALQLDDTNRTARIAMGAYTGSSGYGALYLGAPSAAPTSANHALIGTTGDTEVNSSSTIYMTISGSPQWLMDGVSLRPNTDNTEFLGDSTHRIARANIGTGGFTNDGPTTLNGLLGLKSNTIPTVVAGYGYFWPSNYALYWVTPFKTNLISDGN